MYFKHINTPDFRLINFLNVPLFYNFYSYLHGFLQKFYCFSECPLLQSTHLRKYNFTSLLNENRNYPSELILELWNVKTEIILDM